MTTGVAFSDEPPRQCPGLKNFERRKTSRAAEEFLSRWGREDSNLCRQSQRVYSPSPLTTRTLPRVDRRWILDGRRRAGGAVAQAGGAAPRRAPISSLKARTAFCGR